MTAPVLQLSEVAVDYGRRGQRVRAVDGVDLSVGRGEIVGLVGESGCGKSTLARAAVGLEPLAAGTVTFEGKPSRRSDAGAGPVTCAGCSWSSRTRTSR